MSDILGNVWQENKACAQVFISFNPVETFQTRVILKKIYLYNFLYCLEISDIICDNDIYVSGLKYHYFSRLIFLNTESDFGKL